MDVVAMHISNGIIDGPVSLFYGAIAMGLLALCLYRARQDLSDRLAPMAGLVAAFIFAAQMINFPVLPGVSGHLLGGALAATLVGPWVGALCVSVVLLVQALIFADGGVSALGLNIANMALLGTAVGYLVVVGLMKLLPRTAFGVGAAVFGGSVVSVVLASQGFVLQYFLGGDVDLIVGYGQISATMAGVHSLIGIGEGAIAAITVTAVARVRPDLVYALHGRRLATEATEPAGSATFRGIKPLIAVGALITLAIAGGLSYFASSAPDGLDATTLKGCTVDTDGNITGGSCVAQRAQDHELGSGFLADYGIKGLDSSTGLAGVIGVALTFAIGLIIFWIIRDRRRADRRRADRHRPGQRPGEPVHATINAGRLNQGLNQGPNQAPSQAPNQGPSQAPSHPDPWANVAVPRRRTSGSDAPRGA
ncbi:MAG TPA: energy-coupling factor ABC transporter permease [Candidatus Limnocylindrales bacterium]|nr:energy-coupling factor ABC transporter permease [Candidatus Limnocylindrales bacterium]